jgi:hypothetical protein
VLTEAEQKIVTRAMTSLKIDLTEDARLMAVC